MRSWKGGLAALVLIGAASPAWGHNGPAVIAESATGLVVDGAFDDWPQETRWQDLPFTTRGPADDVDSGGRFAVALDRDSWTLHLALDVIDDVYVSEIQDTRLPDLNQNPDGALIYFDLIHRGSFTESIELSWVRRPILAADQALMDTDLFQFARQVHDTGVRYEAAVALKDLHAALNLPFTPEQGRDAVIGLNVEYFDRDSDTDGAVLKWTAGPRDGEDSRVLGDLFLLSDPDASLQRVQGQTVWREDDRPRAPRQVQLVRRDDPGFQVWGQTHPDGVFHIKAPAGDYEIRTTDPATVLSASTVQTLTLTAEDLSLPHPLATGPDGLPLEALIPALMAESGVRTVGVAVVEDGALSYARTFGVQANGAPATDDTVFRVASITKPVSAAAIFALTAQNQWSLETPLADYWVDPDLTGDPRVQALTSAMALRHLTGLPNWRGGGDLAFIQDPGAGQSYSGEGYEFMRRAVERALDEDFQSLNDRLVFTPAGMQHTHHGWPQGFEDYFAGEYFASGGAVRHSTRDTPNAAANLLSTPTDLARFARWFMQTRAGLDDTAWAEMIRPNPDALISSDGGAAHGLSWLVHEENGRLILEHSGGQWGIRTHLVILPEEGRALVVLTNSSAGWPLIGRIFDATLNADGALAHTREQLYGGSDR